VPACCGHGAVHVGVPPRGGACLSARERGVRSGRAGVARSRQGGMATVHRRVAPRRRHPMELITGVEASVVVR
jgi:hypothetical protein